MKALTRRLLTGAAALLLGVNAVHAQDSALLDALVQKGVLTDQEAEDIRASSAKDMAQSSAGKLAIAASVSQLKLYGDARLRYEYIDENPQIKPAGATYSGNNTVERYRYRLRIGADYTFTNNFMAGFELESSNASDSANQSFGNGFSKNSINIGLVYLQWKPVSWLTLVGGKQRQPLYTTDLTWDADINPEGGAEMASFTFPIDFGSDEPAPLNSDPKAIRAPERAPSDMSLTVGFTAAQYIYADNSEYNTPASANTATAPGGAALTPANAQHNDVWIFAEQVPVQFNFNKTTFVKVVPGFTSYMDGGNTGISGGFTNGTAGSTGWSGGNTLSFYGPNIADHLQIFSAPGEFDTVIGDLPVKAYWDFDLNTDAKARIQDIYLGNGNPAITGGTTAAAKAQNRSLGDNIAWMFGVQIGQNKKKNDWSLKADFRQTGLGAVDPNTNDSDFADSFLNQQGIKVQAVYNFTDFLTGSLAYYDTWNYKKGLMDGTSAGQTPTGLPLAGGGNYAVGSSTASAPGSSLGNLVGANSVQRVQVDLQWKF